MEHREQRRRSRRQDPSRTPEARRYTPVDKEVFADSRLVFGYQNLKGTFRYLMILAVTPLMVSNPR